MLYLLLTADSFRESFLEELGRISKYRVIDERNNLFIAEIAEGKERQLERSAFIYGYFPIYNHSRLAKKSYIKSVYRCIAGLEIDRRKGTKLECFDINCRAGYSAKDIEVRVGTGLEHDGYNINILTPSILAYAVLLNSVCYAGYVNLDGRRREFIDTFRFYKHKEISRAEFKIAEAFDTFKPPAPRIAIDLGAAPGGWSLFLAKSGAAVVAIDNAELEYERIRNAGIDAVVVKNLHGVRLNLERMRRGSIVHLRCAEGPSIAVS